MKLYRVKGGSMSPFLREGDLVLVKELSPGSYRRGAIVVFERDPQELIVHRVVRREGGGVVHVRGDRYGPVERVEVERLRGKVEGVIRSGRVVRVNRAVEWHSWVMSRLDRCLVGIRRRLEAVAHL